MTVKQIAEGFGISEGCLQNWLRQAEIEAAKRMGTTEAESAELRELRNGNRLLEQENEALRRAAAYLSQANLPGKWLYQLVSELAADGIPSRSRAGY